MNDISSLPERLQNKIMPEPNSGCWLWDAATAGRGPKNQYGSVSVKGFKTKKAHRIVYELLVGPIPEGLVTDHLCRNTICVNPSHIEPVTHKENTRRWGHGAETHCPRGHPYNEKNTYRDKRGTRNCRHCNRDRARMMKK